ncbi:hypothetical protein CAPTEDRAFT_208335 [Capitella teleta]|uniref:F5/8 type C domain-containing protein n=1 Tax=Capitella teleta TaxID=283909 RepID=R7V1Y0_CAPTE|nr:hypothetical protein CAPTEDRAFT_208335 [Capitella teleta]|eukprot:ELU09681.1 hypothetical protein CAPTEDRAFT_208335 [Capitella teleta]
MKVASWILFYLRIVSSVAGCDVPVPLIWGVDGAENSQLLASSEASYESSAIMSRITSSTGWCPNPGDTDTWLEVSFGYLQTIVVIQILGSGSRNEYVTKYQLSYRTEGLDWNWYGSNGDTATFNGNTKPFVAVTHNFEPPLLATSLRIHPDEYSGAKTVRWELYGCNTIPVTPYGVTQQATTHGVTQSVTTHGVTDSTMVKAATDSGDLSVNIGSRYPYKY